MGDVQHEIDSLFWVNLFSSAVDGNPGTAGEDVPCFRTAGYRPFHAPTFTIFKEVEGITKSVEKSPDYLLWHEESQVALIVEVKGENSIAEKHFTGQLHDYSLISQEAVESFLENNTGEEATIQHLHVGIVYRDDIYENCLQSDECVERIQRYGNDFLLLVQAPGGHVTCINPEFVAFHELLREYLERGIPLPENPRMEYFVVDNPCTKGIIHGLFEYLIDRVFCGEELAELTLTPLSLRNSVFPYIHVKHAVQKCRNALEYYREHKFCRFVDEEFVFSSDHVEDLAKKQVEFHETLLQYACPAKPPAVQRGFGAFFKPPKPH